MGLKKVGTYATVWEAGMAKSILEAEGVPALNDGDVLGMAAIPGAMGPRIALLVDEEDLDRANEILRRWEESKPADDEKADGENWSAAPDTPDCDAGDEETDDDLKSNANSGTE